MSPRDRNKLVVGIPTLLILLGLILGPATVRYIEAQTQPIQVGFSGGAVGAPILFPDGTSSLPSIAFKNATNTGWFLRNAGAQTVSLVSNGVVALEATGGTDLRIMNGLGLEFAASLNAVDNRINRLAAASMSISNSGTTAASLQLTGTAVTLAIPAGGLGLATVATTSVGATGQGARLVVVCGPTAGTSSLLYYSGTSNTPVVLANAVGGGLIGC